MKSWARLFLAMLLTASAGVLCAQETPAPPPQVNHDVPARVSGGVVAGYLIKKVVPNYPMYAKDRGITGTVVLHVVIGKDGSVKSLEAVSGPDILEKSALDAVKHWKYRPYLLNGQPIEIETTITVNFDLNRLHR